jgi:MFS family permease
MAARNGKRQQTVNQEFFFLLTGHEYPHSRWLVLCVILTAPLLYVIDIFIINMAIPVIKQRLGATHSDVQLVIAGYLTGSACALIPRSKSGRLPGQKKSVLSGHAILYPDFLSMWDIRSLHGN